MRKHNPKNERIKRDYLAYLTEAKRMNSKTVDQVAASLALFEASTAYKDFKAFHIEQARRFKRILMEEPSSETGKLLSKATIHSRLMAVKAFFQWLAGLPGYRSKIHYADAEYFNPSANDSRIANASREKPVPSVEQIRHVIAAMPNVTDIQKRNRALIAFTLLSGARDDAIASLSIRHIDRKARTIFQDARTVRTKARKTISSWFFPVGEDIETIVDEWITHLTQNLMLGPDDPLFPKTAIAVGESGGFEAIGLERKHWTTAGPIRKIFRESFEGAGLPYFNPHSFRNTLALMGERICPNAEVLKAWSQNLGHEKVLTTLTSYGKVASHRQAEIFADLRKNPQNPGTSETPDPATIKRVMDHISRQLAQ